MKYAIMLLSVYKAVCDKIRALLGLTDTITADEIPDKLDEVYEAGKDAEWNKFWDDFQDNGNRRKYGYAFYGKEWNDKTFKPKYDIIIEGTDSHSGYSVFGMAGITDLAEICRKQDIIIDGTNYKPNNPQDWFANCYYLTRTPPIPVHDKFGYGWFYGNCKKLHTVEGFYVSENTTFTVNAFNGCTELQNLNIVGTIGQSGLDLHWSTKLTHASLMNVINCLKNFNEVILENCPVTAWNAFELPTTHTLVEGEKYSLTYEGDNFEIQTAEATVTQIYDMNTHVNALGLEFAMPSYESGCIPLIWIYNDNGKLIYDSYYDPTTNGKIKLTKISTETHSVTLGEANLNKLTDVEKTIATRKGWTLN